MPKKEPVAVTTAKISSTGPIIVAIIGLIGTLVLGYWQFVLKPDKTDPTNETEYIGRVLDVNTQLPIAGAKITLDLEGVPPIVYTDSEGVYRFKVVIESVISGQIRVDAQGYQVYTRNISLSSRLTTIEEIRLTPQFPFTPPESITLMPPAHRTPEESEQIFIVDVQTSSGSKAPPDSSACLWTEASGQGAYTILTLERESIVHSLRVALNEPFVMKIKLTFSDGSQQTLGLDEIRDYEYQNVDLEPVRTSNITVEVLEVKDNSFSNFGICHIEVFGTKP